MPRTWRIRPARADDLQAVAGLLADDELPAEGLREYLGESFCVAVRGADVVGAAGVESYGRNGLLRSVVVATDWRGSAVGSALVADRIGWARARGIESLWLLTTTAARYFERFGFRRIDRAAAPREVRRSPEFVSLCPSSATLMILDLSEPPGEANNAGS